MKTKSLFLSALVSLIFSFASRSQAAGLLDYIAEIQPNQAVVGQTITVRTDSQPVPQNANSAVLSSLLNRYRRGVVPVTTSVAARIFFTGANGQQTIEAQNVVRADSTHYTLTVPNGAYSGKLRLQVDGKTFSLSTSNFTLLSTGYEVENHSQFNVVSVKVDGQERLFPQSVPAWTANQGAFYADIGATPNNHTVQITLGPSLSQPVYTYTTTQPATHPFNLFTVTTLLAGEYLSGSAHATVSGNNTTASWQSVIISVGDVASPAGPSANASTNGFEFTLNNNTGITTWTNWVGRKDNVIARGTLREPTSWFLNPTASSFQLINNNNQIYATITVDFLNKTFSNLLDGNTYELQ